MEEIKTLTVIDQQIRNAVDYGLAMAATATPEQIEQMVRRNELFDRGLQICINCSQESRCELEICESCGESKIPF
jgi:hypothetical protein